MALEHKGQIVAGVIFDPAKDEIFVAEKGQGAWMNDQRLRVSGRTHMIEAIFGTGSPFAGSPVLPEWLKQQARLLPACAGVRRWGAAALDMAYVAAGRLDGYWERGVNAWDIGAGIVIVREAGGLIEALDEGQPMFESHSLVCANGALFDTFAKTVRG